MLVLLVFGATLLLCCLLSELADRSLLSVAGIFLLVGVVAGSTRLVVFDPRSTEFSTFVEITIVAVLFADAGRVNVQTLLRALRLPGRALFLGIPLTIVAIAAAAKAFAGLSWLEGLLLGAILSPTDPVFISGLIHSEGVPRRLRFLLGVESGLNDGLALPFVLGFLALLAHDRISPFQIGAELAAGLGIGFAVTFLALRLERLRAFGVSHQYVPLLGFAILLVVYSLTRLTHANGFLAAFAAGVTVGSFDTKIKDRLLRLNESLGEVFKLGALFYLGAMLVQVHWRELGPGHWLFVALAILLARPLALSVAFLGSHLSWREVLVGGVFGPRGFASVVFGLLVLRSNLPARFELFRLIAAVVSGSILLLSSTDVLARNFLARDGKEEEREPGRPSEVA